MPNRTVRGIRAHPIIAIFFTLAVCLSIPLIAIAGVVGELRDQQDAFIDYQVKDAIKDCRASNRGRKALQKVLDDAANPPPSGAQLVDFSALSGYEALDDSTKFFLDGGPGSLEARLNAPGGSENLQQIADNYRKTNPSNVDCNEVGRNLRKELES